MLKKKSRGKLIFLFAALIFLLTAQMPSAAVYGQTANNQDALKIVLTQGKTGLTANGLSVPCQKPYRYANVFYIPLKAVLETMGADVINAADGSVIVTFMDVTAKIKAGSREYTLNRVKKTLSAPPAISGNVLMVPLELMKCFNVSTTYDSNSGKATILLKDDGSLSDLSFLTGSVTTTKAGNSYFGWNISLPRGTRVATQTFNSKYIQFENEHYGFDLEIFADYNEGKTLKQYYDLIREDPNTTLGVEPIDSSFNPDANLPFIELLYVDSYDEAVYERIYLKEDNFLDIIVTSFDEVDPAKLKTDRTIKAMVDSFSLDYKGNTSNTADLSSVEGGLAKYNNFITSESTGKKYLSWEMNILPEWDLKETSASTPFNTEFDGKPGEYLRVELDMADNNADVEEKGKSMVESYLKNFNPKFFAMKSSEAVQKAEYKYYDMKYEVKYGAKLYDYDERLMIKNGILYDVTFKSPAESFTKELENLDKMIGTFKTSSKDIDKIQEEVQKNTFNLSKNNVGKDDSLSVYENKAYKWKITLPGYWQKNSTSGQSLENFYDRNSGAMIAVEASAIKAGETAKPDQDRFMSMQLSDKLSEKPVKSETEQYKGRNITMYQYRIDDEDSETYADINYYVFDEGGFRYCIMTTMPDLTSSETNLNSLKSIWESFEVTK